MPHRGNLYELRPEGDNDLHVSVWPPDETPADAQAAKWVAHVSMLALGGGGEIRFQAALGATPQEALDKARENYTLAMLYITTRIRAGGALAREVARQEAEDPCPEPLPFEPREPDTSPSDVSHFRG